MAADPSTLDAHIYAFADVTKLERRLLEIEDLVAVIKRHCLEHAALSDLVNATAELRWHLRQVAGHVFDLEHRLGIKGRTVPDVDAPPPTAVNRAPAELRGSTDTLSVPDLLNLLSSLRKTGTLTLQHDSTIYVLEFLEGAIVHAVTNQRSPEWRLGTILEAQCKLTADQLRESLAAIERTKELLGAELVRTERVSESDLRAALELQVRNLFRSIFDLSHARFAFAEGSISNIGQRVCMSTTQLLLDAARRHDEDQLLPGLRERAPETDAPGA